MSRAHQRPALLVLAGLLTLLLVALVVSWIRDSSVVGPSRDEAAANEKAASAFVADIATPDTTSYVLTPGGERWWRLVTGLASQLEVGAATAPEGAKWFATTWAPPHQTDGIPMGQYAAVHVGFATPDEARAFSPHAAQQSCSCQLLVRANVVTITPAWADPYVQPFDLDLETLRVPKDYRVTQARWVADLDATYAGYVGDVPRTEALRESWRHLGFRDDASWDLVANDPAGPWLGEVRGFDAKNVNIAAINSLVADTEQIKCDDGVCETLHPGLSHLSQYVQLSSPSSTWPADSPLGEHQVPAGDGSKPDLSVVTDNAKLTGYVQGTLATSPSWIKHLSFRIDRSRALSLRIVFADAFPAFR